MQAPRTWPAYSSCAVRIPPPCLAFSFSILMTPSPHMHITLPSSPIGGYMVVLSSAYIHHGHAPRKPLLRWQAAALAIIFFCHSQPQVAGVTHLIMHPTTSLTALTPYFLTFTLSRGALQPTALLSHLRPAADIMPVVSSAASSMGHLCSAYPPAH